MAQGHVDTNRGKAKAGGKALPFDLKRSVENEEVHDKEEMPDTGALTRTETEKRRSKSRCVKSDSRRAVYHFLSFQEKQPASRAKEEGEAVGPSGDVIDRGAVHRMHDP